MSASTRRLAAPDIELSGLDRFAVSDLMEVGVPQDNSTGKPLELPLDQVVEDPQQVRSEGNPGFSTESLAELADGLEAPALVIVGDVVAVGDRLAAAAAVPLTA